MKNILKYIITAGAAAAVLTSCDLDLFPKGSIVSVPGVSVIEKQSDLTSMENGILSSYRNRSRDINCTTEEVMYGNFNAATDFANNMGLIHRLEQGITDDYDIRDYWSANYSAIKNFNVLIQSVNDIVDPALKAKAQVTKGYAFLFRAESHLRIVRNFSPADMNSELGIPIITKFDLTYKPARSTVKESYDAIKADLDSAYVLLKDIKGAKGAQKPTVDAVYAEYARYFLDVKDYAKAVEYAEKVISSEAGYKLASSLEDLNTVTFGENSMEAIMQMYTTQQEGKSSISMFTSIANNTSAGYGYVYVPYFIPTKGLIESYEPEDFRFQTWYTNDKRYVRQQGSFYKGDFYVFIRHEGNPALTTSGIPDACRAATPFTLPELYLIAAEASFQSGNTAAAKNYLNTLQAARNASTTDATLANIQKEWVRETTGLGMRLTNLKRWNLGFPERVAQPGALKDFCVLTGADYDQLSMAPGDYHLVWPIPSYEMKVNDNLVQNPGYAVE